MEGTGATSFLLQKLNVAPVPDRKSPPLFVFFLNRPDQFLQRFVLGLALRQSGGVEPFLGDKFAPSRQPRRIYAAVSYPSIDRASWFAVMLAVVEPALICQGRQIFKDIGDTRFNVGELDFSHPRRVEKPASVGVEVQLPPCGRVTAFAVIFPNSAGLDVLGPEKGIDQR